MFHRSLVVRYQWTACSKKGLPLTVLCANLAVGCSVKRNKLATPCLSEEDECLHSPESAVGLCMNMAVVVNGCAYSVMGWELDISSFFPDQRNQVRPVSVIS